jgi:hypothetical protein
LPYSAGRGYSFYRASKIRAEAYLLHQGDGECPGGGYVARRLPVSVPNKALATTAILAGPPLTMPSRDWARSIKNLRPRYRGESEKIAGNQPIDKSNPNGFLPADLKRLAKGK